MVAAYALDEITDVAVACSFDKAIVVVIPHVPDEVVNEEEACKTYYVTHVTPEEANDLAATQASS